MMFTYCPNFDVSSFSVTGDIDFETGHFASFEQFKIDLYFANFGQAKIDPFVVFYYFGQVTAILLHLGKTYCEKQAKKFKNHA